MKNIYLARQPIYTKDLDVFAYELLFRENEENTANVIDNDMATSQVLLNSLIEIGMDIIVASKPAFINIPQNYILRQLPQPVAPNKIVLEILEDVEANEEMIEKLQQLKQENNYIIALDDFIFHPSKVPLIELADFIKIDIDALTTEEVEQQLQLLRPFPAKLTAEKVETYEQFEWCKLNKFDFFQGYFFCRPDIVKGQRIPASRLSALQLLTELQAPNIPLSDLEKLISNDVSMSYRLLRYINSAKFSLDRSVDDIKTAVNLLGLATLKTLVTIITMSQFDDKPYELMAISLIRAKMCELVADHLNKDSRSIFIVGLFSSLDALIDKPMDEVLESLPLGDPVKLALLANKGEMGEILQYVLSFEKGDWEELNNLNISTHTTQNIYSQAISWAHEVNENLLAA